MSGDMGGAGMMKPDDELPEGMEFGEQSEGFELGERSDGFEPGDGRGGKGGFSQMDFEDAVTEFEIKNGGNMFMVLAN